MFVYDTIVYDLTKVKIDTQSNEQQYSILRVNHDSL